jgi:hypothetical protein
MIENVWEQPYMYQVLLRQHRNVTGWWDNDYAWSNLYDKYSVRLLLLDSALPVSDLLSCFFIIIGLLPRCVGSSLVVLVSSSSSLFLSCLLSKSQDRLLSLQAMAILHARARCQRRRCSPRVTPIVQHYGLIARTTVRHRAPWINRSYHRAPWINRSYRNRTMHQSLVPPCTMH